MSIGEFAKRSQLSPKALCDKLGLLAPARVDGDSGYRSYEAAQLERARFVAALRQIQVPLTEIKTTLTSSHFPPPRASTSTGRLPRLSTPLGVNWPLPC
jgi:PPM family protein phosphatase